MARIARLRVLETTAAGEIQSSRAVDTADGAKLILHTGGLSLLDVADTLGADVLERGETGGKVYILTPDRPELQNLNGPRMEAPPVQEPGEFTRMFQIPKVAQSPEGATPPVAAQPLPAPAAPPSSASPSSPSRADADTAGEFTRMYRAVSTEPVKPAPDASKAALAPLAADKPSAELPTVEHPGPAPSTPAANAPAAGGSDFGFTGMFNAVSRISVESEPPKTIKSEPPAKEEAPPAAPPPPPASSGPGEFTSFFRAPAAPPTPRPVTAQPVRPAPSTPQINPEPTKPELSKPESTRPEPLMEPADSEFTRMFQATPTDRRPPAATPTQASAPPSPEAQEQPQRARPMDGEFTRMFNARPTSIPNPPPRPTYPVPPSPASSTPSVPVDDPGVFTRQFQAPASPASTPPAAPLPLPPKPNQSSDSGEFTRFFKDPLPVGREPDWKAIEKQGPPPPSAKPEGDFTKMFGRPGGGAAPPPQAAGGAASDLFQAQRPAATSAPPSSPKPGAPAGGAPAGGDEYGKMFAPKPDAAPSLKAPPKLAAIPVEAPAKKPPVVLLVIIIVALVVIAGAALYYFVLKPK